MPASRSQRVVVVVGDRLVGDVAARHHERPPGVGEQQVVERRVRQHHAELGRARARPTAATRRVRAPAGEHDRPRAGERAARSSSRVSSTSVARRREVGGHQRERLVLAVLARAQRGDRVLVVGAAGEVEAAEALDRHDRARPRSARAAAATGSARAARPRRRLDEPHARPAVGAGVRLGVEAAVGRVVVLGAAGRAHLEAGHRRERPVVRDAAHDREARAAVGAVDERVAVAAVGGVEQLGEAVVAGGAVGRDRGARLAAAPGCRGSRSRARRARSSCSAVTRARPARAAAPRPAAAPGSARPPRLGASTSTTHAARVVQHVARQAQLVGQPVDVGPEADALDRALDARPRPGSRPSLHPTSSRSTW